MLYLDGVVDKLITIEFWHSNGKFYENKHFINYYDQLDAKKFICKFKQPNIDTYYKIFFENNSQDNILLNSIGNDFFSNIIKYQALLLRITKFLLKEIITDNEIIHVDQENYKNLDAYFAIYAAQLMYKKYFKVANEF